MKRIFLVACISVPMTLFCFVSVGTLSSFGCAATSGAQADSALQHYEKIKTALWDSYKVLPPANPGEWRDSYKEKFQSFEEYIKSKPVRPDDKKNVIYIQPIGTLDSTRQEIVNETAAYMEIFFSLKVKINAPLPDSLVPQTSRRMKFDQEQFHTKYILDKILKPRLPDDAVTMIAITKYDLYPEDSWNFVFGQAYLKQHIGVWSLARFGDPSANPGAFVQCMIRTFKTSLHETGHMFSLPHCVQYRCLMNGSNSLPESDAKALYLCPDCICKLSWNRGITEKEFVNKQLGYWKDGQDGEALIYYTKCVKSLEK